MFEFIGGPGAMFIALGILSGVLSSFAYIPYIRDTLARRTQPQRASWLIWSTLGSIAFFSQIYEGAGSSLWFAGVQVGGTIIVFLLSIHRGTGGFLKRSDCLVLACAAIGLILWYFTENAGYALAITTSISLLGGSMTVVKAYRDPQSETMQTWVMSLIASTFAIISVGNVDWVLLAYPLYLFTLNGAIVMAIALGQERDAQAETLGAQDLSALPFTLARRAPLRTPLPQVRHRSFLPGTHRPQSIGRWHPPAAG